MARVAVTISLSDDERAELEALSRRRKTSQGLARRARIVLAAAEGLENKEIAVRLEASADTVGKWRRRYAAEGLDGLYDEPRPGAPRPTPSAMDAAPDRGSSPEHSAHPAGLQRMEALVETCENGPPAGLFWRQTHWSLRSIPGITAASSSSSWFPC